MHCWKHVPPSLRCPASSRRERGAALGRGTYLRISLQNSRAVRGQPLFSRNIRCLKRARKKALCGEQQQGLEARFGEKHLVPLKNSPSSLPPEHQWHCAASGVQGTQPGAVQGTSDTPCSHLLFFLISLCKYKDSKPTACSADWGRQLRTRETSKSPKSASSLVPAHPAMQRRGCSACTTHTGGGLMPRLVLQITAFRSQTVRSPSVSRYWKSEQPPGTAVWER